MDALNFRNARVLVTGGAGLIGSHIVDRLVAESALEIVVLDNFVRGRRDNLAGAMKSGRVTIVEGDIRDRALLGDVMHRIDVVFHQAALRITQCAEEPALAMDVLVNGTFLDLQTLKPLPLTHKGAPAGYRVLTSGGRPTALATSE